MAAVDEAVAAKPPLGSDLAEGIKANSANEQVTFNRYIRLVLPLDGFVFWARASQLSQSALYNAMVFNQAYFNQMRRQTAVEFTNSSVSSIANFVIGTSPIQSLAGTNNQITVTGSFHYSTQMQQEETETFAVNRILFTSLSPVDAFNEVGPDEIWIGEYQDQRFAFSSRGDYYEQADLWHYVGNAVYADMATQIVDAPQTLDTSSPIVSNSLPIWLSLNNVNDTFPNWPIQPGYPALRLFPSMLGKQNNVPPFGSVHIEPNGTRGIAAYPTFGSNYSHTQLCEDSVRVTLYGLRNSDALDFVDFVQQYGLDSGLYGVMNIPVIRDEKRGQVELQALAQKKTVDFRINYYQSRMNDLARQLIKQAFVTVTVTEMVA